MRAHVAVLLLGVVLCVAHAQEELAMANPFLRDASVGAFDEAAADLELRTARFRLQRQAQAGRAAVPQPRAISFVETDALTAPAVAAAGPVPAAAASVPAAAAAVPALLETAKPAAADKEKAPFMPGWDEKTEEPVHTAPLPPPAPLSDAALDTLKIAVQAPAHARAAAAVADVSEQEAADLLAQVSAVVAGNPPRHSGAAHRFAALRAKHAGAKAFARRNGYGAPGQRDRSHRHRRNYQQHEDEEEEEVEEVEEDEEEVEEEAHESPRFATKTEADLVADARARAAALMAAEAQRTQEAVASMSRAYSGAESAAEAESATASEVASEHAAALQDMRAKRARYALHSRRVEDQLHRFLALHHGRAEADTDAQTDAAAEAEGEAENESQAEADADAEHDAEHEHDAEADTAAETEGEAEVDAETQALAEAEAEAQAQAEAEAEAKAEAAKTKAEADAKAAEAKVKAEAAKQPQPAVLGARFAQVHVKSRHRARGGAAAAPGYGPPLHAPIDTHGAPPVMSSTVDLPLNRPPTPNYFYPPTANPPPAPIQTPRLPSLDPNPAPFAPQFPNADAYRSHQLNPYGQFQQIAPPMQREPPASLYPPYSTVPNFEQPAPRTGLAIDLPEPAGGAPSLVEWNAAVHRNTHYDAAAAAEQQKGADRPITAFAGFSLPVPNHQAPQF